MIKYTSYINLLLVTIYVLSVFVDLLNGYNQQVTGSDTIIPLVFKGAIILLSVFYIYKNYHILNITLFLLIFYLILFLYWDLAGYILNLNVAISNFSKFIYPLSVWLILEGNKKYLNINKLLFFLMIYGFTIACSVLIIDFFGLSVNSYGENYGYGVKGFFKAGNDISLTLVLSTCISSYLLSIKNETKYMFFNVILLVALMRVGTTASFLGVVINALGLILQPMFVENKLSLSFKIYRVLLVLIGLPFAIYALSVIIATDTYTLNKFSVDYILSGGARNTLKDAFYNIYNDFSLLDYILGVGHEELGARVGGNLGLGEYRSLEVNHLELIGTYGVLLGILLLFIPIIFLLRYFMDYLKNKRSFSFWMILTIFVFIAHGIFAGHAYNSIQGMSLIVGIYYLYKYRFYFK